MSKKNRKLWRKVSPAAQPSPATTEPRVPTSGAVQSAAVAASPCLPPDFSAISPAQLAANRANAQLSTGPRTDAGRAKSSQNAVKTALTGRTVLLPTDDVEEYAAFLAGFEQDLAPVGQLECELVQSIADTHWRLRRIQALEFALYAHGHEQFEHAFDDRPEDMRYNMILLQTHMTYEKQFRNFQIQEARLQRRREKDMAELRRLQEERKSDQQDLQNPERQRRESFRAAASVENGFDFSNSECAALSSAYQTLPSSQPPFPHGL